MNVTPINRITNLSTSVSMDEPLSNLLTESPGEIAKSLTTSLQFTVDTVGVVDALSFFHTNADTIVVEYNNLDSTPPHEVIQDGTFDNGTSFWKSDKGRLRVNNNRCEWNDPPTIPADILRQKNQDGSTYVPLGLKVGNQATISFDCSNNNNPPSGNHDQGKITEVSFGGVTLPVPDGTTHFNQTITIVDPNDGFSLKVSSNYFTFNGYGWIDNISVITPSSFYETISYQFNAINTFGNVLSPRERNVQILTPKTFATNNTFTITLTSTENVFLGTLWAGQRKFFDCNPNYDLSLDHESNDVQIDRLDGSRYRRHRPARRIFSGLNMGDNAATKPIRLFEDITRQLGTKPMPWVLVDYRGEETLIFGGLFANKKTFEYYAYDNVDFEIREEL